MTLPAIPICAYKKMDLRKLILNPDLNLRDEQAVSNAIPLPYRKWLPLLNKLKNRLPEDEWKYNQILSATAVKILLEGDAKKVNGSKR